MIPAAAYIRVSSDMQVEQGSSLPSQLAAVKDFAAKNNYVIADEYIFTDEGISARTDDRPAFRRMVALAKQKTPPFRAIICYESSRFSRNREDSIVYKGLLRRRGIEIRFVKQDFGDGPTAMLMEGITEVIDEWFSANFAIETVRGHKQNVRDGYSTGGRPPYGLRVGHTQNEHGKDKSVWEPNPETAPIVQRIYAEYAGGNGYNIITDGLNRDQVPSPSGGSWNKNTLHYILHHNTAAYLGTQIYGRQKPRKLHFDGKYNPSDQWEIKENAWEAVITKEEAVMVEKRAKHYQSHPRQERDEKDGPRYLLTGRIYCGECGAAMVGTTCGRNSYYYRCNTRSLKGNTCCAAPLASTAKIEGAVIGAIKKHLCDAEFLKKIYADGQERYKNIEPSDKDSIEKLRESLGKIEKKRNRIIENIADGVIHGKQARPILEKLDADETELGDRLRQAEYYAASAPVDEISYDAFCELVGIYLCEDKCTSNMVLIQAFVTRVDVWPDHVKICFTISLPDGNRDVCNVGVESSPPF